MCGPGHDLLAVVDLDAGGFEGGLVLGDDGRQLLLDGVDEERPVNHTSTHGAPDQQCAYSGVRLVEGAVHGVGGHHKGTMCDPERHFSHVGWMQHMQQTIPVRGKGRRESVSQPARRRVRSG